MGGLPRFVLYWVSTTRTCFVVGKRQPNAKCEIKVAFAYSYTPTPEPAPAPTAAVTVATTPVVTPAHAVAQYARKPGLSPSPSSALSAPSFAPPRVIQPISPGSPSQRSTILNTRPSSVEGRPDVRRADKLRVRPKKTRRRTGSRLVCCSRG